MAGNFCTAAILLTDGILQRQRQICIPHAVAKYRLVIRNCSKISPSIRRAGEHGGGEKVTPSRVIAGPLYDSAPSAFRPSLPRSGALPNLGEFLELEPP